MSGVSNILVIEVIVFLLTISVFVLIIFYRNRRMHIERMMFQDTEERMQLLIDSAPLGVNLIDKNYNTLLVNKEALRLFGITSKQEYAARIHKDLSPEYQPDGRLSSEKGHCMIREGFENGYSRHEWMHLKPNGEFLPCEITMVRTEYKGEHVLIVYARDLREEKKIQQKLHEVEDMQQMMLNTSPLAIIFFNKDLDIIDCNMSALEIFEQYDKQKFIDDFHSALMPTHQPSGDTSNLLIQWHLERVLKDGYRRFEWLHMKADGTPFPCEVTVVRQSSKEQTYLVAHTRDLSETKHAVKKMIEAEEANRQLQTIFDLLPVGIVIIRAEGFDLLYANKAAENIYKVESFEKDAMNRSIFDFAPEVQPDGRKTVDIVRELLAKGESASEMQHIRATGETFWVRVSYCIINYNNILATLNVIEDITAEKDYQKKLQTIAQNEKEANKLKSRFLAVMSHEIRTPMNAILGIAEMQLQRENLLPETEEAFDKIYESGDLLLNIINDILDLSKIEAGKMEIIPAKYDIPSLINDTITINRLRYESKPIEFKLKIDENTPHDLIGDELRIKQILSNLLSNAFKYTDKGTVTLSVSTQTPENNTAIVFKVTDTGQGMTKDQIDKLFVEYTRFNMEANRTTVGAGLGLSITKRLLDMMNGEIVVESEPGKGTTFTVRIPQEFVGSSVCGPDLADKLLSFTFNGSSIKKKKQFLREYMPHGSVLIVDDVHSNLYVAKGMLMPYGLQIETANSGFEAIEKVKQGKTYDIIFMDHMMPKMDGIEALNILREMGYTKPIVALTANALLGQQEMFLQQGFDGYISKPIDSRELNIVLNKMILGGVKL